MPVVHGNKGSVSVGNDTVGKVQDFSLQVEAETSDSTGMGETWKDHETGAAKGWSGSVNVLLSTGDTGQAALVVGASVTLHLYAAGNQSGNEYYSGIATVTAKGHSQNRTDTVAVSFDFEGKGELTTPTVS